MTIASSKKTYHWFRKIALIEGISYLVLLLVAMPLKYFAEMPMAVTIVGSIHGALFVALMIYIYLVHEQYGNTLKWMINAFVASIIPFGTFIWDREWKKEESLV